VRTVLACLDTSAASRPVLESALKLARLTGADVEAVHLPTDGSATVERLASHNAVGLRLLTGPVERALRGAVAERGVIAAVLGARGTVDGRRPPGRTTLNILEHVGKPILVVPPEAGGLPTGAFRRLLVPLEGIDASSRLVAEALSDLIVADVELVALHVFTPGSSPRVLDRPVRDLQILGGEFLARHLAGAGRIEMRTGPVAATVCEVCRQEGTDLIVMGWSQDRSGGRAAVILEVLGQSPAPILVLPFGHTPGVEPKTD